MKHAAALGAVTIALSMLCGPLHAQQQVAYTAKTVNLRAGPARDYPIVAVLGPGLQILVEGCLGDYSWCDVVYGPSRGWVYGGNISYQYQNSWVPLMPYGPLIGLGIIGFAFDDYWDRYYRDRPFFAQRHRWARHPLPHPRPALPVPPVPQQGFGARPFPREGAPFPREGRPFPTRPQHAAPPVLPVPQPQGGVQRQAVPGPRPQPGPVPLPRPQGAVPRPQGAVPGPVPQPRAQAQPHAQPQPHAAPPRPQPQVRPVPAVRAAPPAAAPRPHPRQDNGEQRQPRSDR